MSNLSLSQDPNSDLIDHIERYGGKLGVLELISKLYQEDPEPFDAIGIKVGPRYTPTILLPGQAITSEILNTMSQRYGSKNNPTILIRGSLPGDYKSLVDVIPTTPHNISRTTSRRINEAMVKTRNEVRKSAPGIEKYAQLAGVPFDQNNLTFGFVPKFSSNHLSITEHPNHVGVFIEEYFEPHHDHPKYTEIGEGRVSGNISKISRFIELLREKGILDKHIAYNFELGLNDDKDLVLYQIRELCKKVPVNTRALTFSHYQSNNVHSILTTIPQGKRRIFLVQTNMFQPYNNPNSTPVLGEFKADWIYEKDGLLNPNAKGLLIESNGVPTIGGHDIMRHAQYALQSINGGIVVLGEYTGSKSYPPAMQKALAPEGDGTRIEITHAPEGRLESKTLPN